VIGPPTVKVKTGSSFNPTAPGRPVPVETDQLTNRASERPGVAYSMGRTGAARAAFAAGSVELVTRAFGVALSINWDRVQTGSTVFQQPASTVKAEELVAGGALVERQVEEHRTCV